jgi:hypothetical protein
MTGRVLVASVGAVVVLCVLGLAQLHGGTPQSPAQSADGDAVASSAADGEPAALTPHRHTLRDVEAFWMAPSGSDVRGVLLLFHGCTHRGVDWFQLPEDSRIVRAALRCGSVWRGVV